MVDRQCHHQAFEEELGRRDGLKEVAGLRGTVLTRLLVEER